MLKWHKQLIDHGLNIQILNTSQAKAINVGYGVISKINYDEVISNNKEERGIFVEQFEHGTDNRVETFVFNSIREYLGY